MAFKFNPFTGNFDVVNAPVWQKNSSSIVASATTAVDTLAGTDFDHLQYIVHIRNGDKTKLRSFNLIVDQDDVDITDQLFARNGKALNVTIDPQFNAGVFTLNITNNESELIEVRYARMLLK